MAHHHRSALRFLRPALTTQKNRDKRNSTKARQGFYPPLLLQRPVAYLIMPSQKW